MKKVKLSDIVDIQVGRTPSRANLEYWGAGYDWLTISDLNDLEKGKYIMKSTEQITDKAIKETGCVIVETNTILYSFKLSIGKVCITQKPFYTNEAIAALKIKHPDRFTSDFLFYALKSLDTSALEDQGAKGFTLNKAKLSQLEIPIFDLETQNSIVTTLDKIQSIIEKRKETIALLDELLRVMFLEMFGEIKNGWRRGNFDDVILQTQYGISKPLSEEKTEYPVLRMNNITARGDLDLSKLKWGKLTKEEAIRYELNKRDVIFNRTNSRELVGKTAVWDVDGRYYFAGYLVRIVVNEDLVNPYFISGFLNSNFGKKMLFTYAKSSGSQANFSPPQLLKQFIFMPPIELQKQYEESVCQINKEKARILYSLSSLESLFHLVLRKAFSKSGLIGMSEVDTYLNDIILQEELINKIKSREFQVAEEYNKAQSLLFQLLETGKSSISQELETLIDSDGKEYKYVNLKTHIDK